MPSILSFILLFFITTVNADEIKPFTTDGCSIFPDGTFTQNDLWLACCTAHDFTYWQGGSATQRLIADKQLEHCVTQLGEPEIAALMLAGARIGGSPYLPTGFRWGYGWSYLRGYKILTTDEKQQIKSLLKHRQ